MKVAIVCIAITASTGVWSGVVRCNTAAAQQIAAYGEIRGVVYDKSSGKALPFANVMLLGTTMGAGARAGGAFRITTVPIGTYQVRASYIGYVPLVQTDVQVDAGKTVQLEFHLVQSRGTVLETVRVRGHRRDIEVEASDVTHIQTADQLKNLPVQDNLEALTLETGVVMTAGELHVRGGRGGEVSIRIDGVSVDDPLSGGSLDIGMLSLSQQELITGGMDAQYGNASSAIVNYTTKSGGTSFEGNFLYMTDDYGRADKTFTNFDRISLGMGGPSPFENLTYYVSGEATFEDGEFLSTKNYEERRLLGGLVKIKDRVSSDYRVQTRLDWKLSRQVRMSGELTLNASVSDPYLHNWNTAGGVARILVFPEVRANRFQPQFFAVASDNTVTMYYGPWYERARAATFIDFRLDPGCQTCLLPVSDNQTVRALRVVDIQGRGADPARPVFALVDYVVFDGWQNSASRWTPEIGAADADTNKTRYNAAEHVWTNENTSRQLKWTLTQTLSAKTFYDVKVSRLSFDVLNTVNGKLPEEYATAGKYLWAPGRGPRPVGNVSFYTDPEVPYFVTAYDLPSYSRRNTETYLLRSDITTQRWQDHKIKAGLTLQYNDLDSAVLGNPGQQRQFRDPYGFTRNVFHNFQPEGSFYVQDRWDHEGMVVNGGLRYDFFSPGSGVGIELNSTEIPRDVKRWQTQWSPRLGLAFPITERDVFHFHYGRFIQFPEKAFIFASQDPNAGTILGNPNLEPETSISYQAGIKHQFSRDLSGQFALFNKDYFGLVSSIEVTDDSLGVQRLRFINKSYASSRGVEFQLNKNFSRGFAFDLAYTFSFADGVASSADFGRQAQGLTHLPTGELPLDWDQRHAFNATVSVARSGDWSATSTYQYSSGQPWTPFFRFEKKQDPLLENARRFPPTHTVNVQGEKFFAVRGQELRFFFQGRNLLDEQVIVNVEPGVFPAPANATEAYRAYATETGRFGGAYLNDTDGDGADEFVAVNDPRVYGQRRLFRIGLGFEF